MADISYTTLKEWGMDTFIVQDYIGYIENEIREVGNIPELCKDEYFAGMIIYSKEDLHSVLSFIKLCRAAGVSCIRIDYSHLDNNDNNKNFIRELKGLIDNEIGESYLDLESYEYSFAYGLRAYERWILNE